MSFFEEICEKGIYFIFNDRADLFAQFSICLAEGFQKLGIPIFGNRNYWLTSLEPEEYLFSYSPEVAAIDCSLRVVDISQCSPEQAQFMIENEFLENKNVPIIVVDQSDSDINIPAFQDVSYVFCTHMTNLRQYPSHFIPWCFGISDRIAEATAHSTPFSRRKKEALVNFRPSHNQSVRLAMEFILVPWLDQYFSINREVDSPLDEPSEIQDDTFHYLNWYQLRSRHNPRYYKRLKEAMICCAYGGNFLYLGNHYMYMGNQPGVVRWDSWRLWESLAAGCVTIHLDFEAHGFQMPIMPINWEHYVGLDLKNCKDAVERLNDEPGLMERISVQGKEWAFKHYSPVPTACYFLDVITGEPYGTTEYLLSLISSEIESV